MGSSTAVPRAFFWKDLSEGRGRRLFSAKKRGRRAFSAIKGGVDFFSSKNGRWLFSKKTKQAKCFFTIPRESRGRVLFSGERRGAGLSSFSGIPLPVQYWAMVMVSNKCRAYCWIDISYLKSGSFRAVWAWEIVLSVFLRLADSICLILRIVIADNVIWQKWWEQYFLPKSGAFSG